MSDKINLYFDGASKKNPGKAGSAYYVEDGDSSYGGYKYLGIATNNEAEYNGLILGLKAIAKFTKYEVVVHGDSKLVIEQMKGKWKVKAENLKPLWEECKTLSNEFENISFKWIDRSKNKEADALANVAIVTKSSNYH